MNNPMALLRAVPSDESVLVHVVDRYNGVTIPETSLRDVRDTAQFARLLRASLDRWTAEKRRGLWLQIPIEKSALIPVAVEEAFEFHHAQPRYVMMTCWLPNREWTTRRMAASRAPTDGLSQQTPTMSSDQCDDTTHLHPPPSPRARPQTPPPECSLIPQYATSSLGVGCVVLNKAGQCLVIQEKIPHPLLPDWWKLPGGAIDRGEDINVAAEREVLEETGVRAKFRSLIGFRHLLNFRFGTGDLYFLGICTVEDENDCTPVAQPEEIGAVKWWDFQEFMSFHSARWMASLVREPVLAEWHKLFPGHTLPPPPSAERMAELARMPPHPKAHEGKDWPEFVPPVAPAQACSVGMVNVVTKSALSPPSNFYIVPAPAVKESANSDGAASSSSSSSSSSGSSGSKL